jgi:hypothetical protein
MKIKTLEFLGNGSVFAGDLYLDDPETLSGVLAQLTNLGYQIQNLRESESRLEKKISVETMEQDSFSLWFATLERESYTFARCPHCQTLSPTQGCRCKDHICPHCGKRTEGRTGIVRVWDGIEYDEWDFNFPVPETISIYETWHWAPMPKSPKLHEFIMGALGQVSRQDYYYQDGRAAFSHAQINGMRRFALRYTAITQAEWDAVRWRLDGPGFIAQLAYLCHSAPVIRNEPNMFNTLNALADAASGIKLTDWEVAQAQAGSQQLSDNWKF